MNRSCYLALGQADNAAALNAPYQPRDSFVLAAKKLCREGYLQRRQTGGFQITESGLRVLAASRNHNYGVAQKQQTYGS